MTRRPPRCIPVSFLVLLPLAGCDSETVSRGRYGPCIMTGANPSSDWSFEVGDRIEVPNTANVPDFIWTWQPDGHISVLPDGEGGFMMYWALSIAWRTTGTSAYPEDMTRSDPNREVFGGERDESAWDSGGSWLMSVIRRPDGGLVGFCHAEDHWWPQENPENIAWKSIGVTHSTDNGRSWTAGSQIITAHLTKPPTPEWGGAGDNSAVWDCRNRRFVIYYSEKVTNFRISAAATHDPSGRTGWKKWNGSGFNSPAIGGKSTPLPGLFDQPGANPSVMWNTFLEKWVMVWHGWNGNTYLASSTDGIHWDRPRLVTRPVAGRVHAWYPTLIDGAKGDSVGGRDVRLYYADVSDDVDVRDFVYRKITFVRKD